MWHNEKYIYYIPKAECVYRGECLNDTCSPQEHSVSWKTSNVTTCRSPNQTKDPIGVGLVYTDDHFDLRTGACVGIHRYHSWSLLEEGSTPTFTFHDGQQQMSHDRRQLAWFLFVLCPFEHFNYWYFMLSIEFMQHELIEIKMSGVNKANSS